LYARSTKNFALEKYFIPPKNELQHFCNNLVTIYDLFYLSKNNLFFALQ